MKECSSCTAYLPLARFRLDPRYALGVHSQCLDCARERNRRFMARLNEQRRKASRCRACGGEPLPNSAHCLLHWAVRIGTDRRRGGIHSLAMATLMLQKLEQQGYRCAITGEVLVPAVNASLDHIVPQSKGGSHDIDNLQWVIKDVNRARHNLSLSEFIDLCRRVVAHADRHSPHSRALGQ